MEQAIKQLDYKPSPLARSMRTGKTQTLAVVVPDIINPFFAEVYNSIRLSAAQIGYTSILYTTEDDMVILQNYLSSISLRQVDGTILCFLDEDDNLDNFIAHVQSQIPLLLLSWDVNNTRFNSIAVDVYEGIYKSVNYLLSLGHESIAYIGGPENSMISKQKFQGFIKAMKEADKEINPCFIHQGNYSLQYGFKSTRNLMMIPNPPTAIVNANDILALGSLKYLLHKKIRVPKEVAVIGFDNISLSSMYEPALSTISLPIAQMCDEAVKLILSKIETPASKNKQIILNTELIVRNSTDANTPVVFDV